MFDIFVLNNTSNSLPTNTLLNMTYNCETKKLSVHIHINTPVEVIPHVIHFNSFTFSISMFVDSKEPFETALFSGQTTILKIPAFVAVQFKFSSKAIDIRGSPTAKAINIQNAISGTNLKAPPATIGSISNVYILGDTKKGVTTVAMRGSSRGQTVVLIQQVSRNISSTALIAGVHNTRLKDLVTSSLDTDITGLPLFGDLILSRVSFSSATGHITSSLLPRLLPPNSPLAVFSGGVPRGIRAHFTARIAGVRLSGELNQKKLVFELPSSSPLTLSQLLRQHSELSSFASFPLVQRSILACRVTGLSFDPESKVFVLSAHLPRLSLIPIVMGLSSVALEIRATLEQGVSVNQFLLTGTWAVGSLNVTTHVSYNSTQRIYRVRASPKKTQYFLKINTLFNNVLGSNLPENLKSLTLTRVVGSINSNGNYFLVMSGSFSSGSACLVFLKDSTGTKVGLMAGVERMKLSDIVESFNGMDISETPYFGQLTLSMAVSVTSGPIERARLTSALPNIFNSKVPTNSSTFPAGVSAWFSTNVSGVSGVECSFLGGVVGCSFPDSVGFSVRDLGQEIPGLTQAVQALPPPVASIVNAKILSFSLNTTTNGLSVVVKMERLTIAKDFLSLSGVRVMYEGTLGSSLSTNSVEIAGVWSILERSVSISVVYDRQRKEFSISSSSSGKIAVSDVVLRFIGSSLNLPSSIPSLTLTGITGEVGRDNVVVALNGAIESGKIACVFQRSVKGSSGAVVFDVSRFKLADLVRLASGADISDVPYFGALEIPRLRFAVSTTDITSETLQRITMSGSPLEIFRNGISEGVTGRSVFQMGKAGFVALKFENKLLTFKVTNTSSITLSAILSAMPGIQDIASNLPSRLSGVLRANVQAFSFDPASNELALNVSMKDSVDLVPNLISLSQVKVSVVAVLGQQKELKTVVLRGSVKFGGIPIDTSVSYDGSSKILRIKGELNQQVDLKDLISSLTDKTLRIPQIIPPVRLSKLTGTVSDNVTFIALAGTISEGEVYFVYQKPSAQPAAVGLAVGMENLRLSSLVSSALGVDISSTPYFGTLVISGVGLTVSSQYITSPLLSALYPPSSALTVFGGSLDKGLRATFPLTLGGVRGITASFAGGKLDLEIPKSSKLPLSKLLQLLPNLKRVIDTLPQKFKNMADTALSALEYRPRIGEIELEGSIGATSIIPNFLVLQNTNFSLLGNIGRNSSLKFASFTGQWVLNSLSLTTKVVYDGGIVVIDAYPEKVKGLNLQDFISIITKQRVNIPPALKTIEITRVLGKLEKGVKSLVFIGRMGNHANLSIVYERSQSGNVVVFAADVKEMKLSDLILAGTGADISQVPFFGSLSLPATSFAISSDNFSTLNLPDLDTPGIPTELFLETIPKGVKGQVRLNIGKAVGMMGEYEGGSLTIRPPTSIPLTLLDLLSVLPQMRTVTDSLPPMFQTIRKANINSLVYQPSPNKRLTSPNINSLVYPSSPGKFSVSLNINSLTIIPKLLVLEEVAVSLEANITGTRASAQNIREFTDYAEVQAMRVNELIIKGKWKFLGIKISMFVRYDGQTKKFSIKGTPPTNAKTLSISNILSQFSAAKLKVPQISGLKLDSVRALSSPSDNNTKLIVTATAGTSNRMHLILQRGRNGSSIAVAADLQFSLVQLIKTVANIDMSSVPFINSFEVASMAITASTGPLHTPLLRDVFESDSPLWRYVRGIPSGLSAYLKVVIGSCLEVEVTYIKNKLSFVVPHKCRVTLRDILAEIPVIKSLVKVLPPPISDLLASDLKGIHFDPPTKTLSVNATFPELNLFKVLVMRNLQLSLVAALGAGGGVRSFSFSGDLVLCDVTVKTSVSYNQTTQELLFEASPKHGLSISSITKCLFKGDFKVPSFLNAVKITNIVGQKVSDTFSFVLSGRISTKFQVYLVYKRSVGEKTQFAVAASVKSFKLSDLLKEAANIDISSVPYFGSLRIPQCGLSIASGNITTPLLNRMLPASSPLKTYANNLPSGFTASIDLSLRDGKRFRGTYANKSLPFTPFGGEITLGSLLNEIPGINIKSTGITGVFKDIANMRIKRFVFDIEKKLIEVSVYLPKLPLFGKTLSIHDITVAVNATLSKPRDVSVGAKGIFKLGKKDYKISIDRDPSTKVYVLTLNTQKFPVTNLLSAVGGSFLPEDLQLLLGKIFDINVLNATVRYPIGVKPKYMVISGMPQLFGLKTVHVTALLIKQGRKTQMVPKYTIPQFSIADILKKMFKTSIPSRLLQEKADISFITSPTTFTPREGALSVPEFKGIEVSEGVSVSTKVGWPSSCGSDVFCRFMKILLGGGTLTLQGTFNNARYFSIRAGVSDVNMGGGVVLKRAGVEFVGGVEQSVGLVGSIQLKSPPVTLNAAIRLTPSGVQLQGSMSGCWYKAFGNPYLAICRLLLEMTLAPITPPITGLEFGGRVEIGKRDCSKGKLLTAEAYVGINSLDVKENYFYADIGVLTFQRFFDAFCLDVSLPKALGDSGFPKGLKTSFSLLGKELPHAGIKIPIGFRFKGTLNILGLSAMADINIQPSRLKVYAEVSPVNIFGIFKMYRSRNEKKKGPFFHIDISPTTKSLLVNMSGFVEVLGISRGGHLLISKTKYELFIEGPLLGIFRASLRITAKYSKNIRDAYFEVEGQFHNDLFDRIIRGVSGALKKSADEADKHISAAQDKVNAAKAKVDDVINKLEQVKRRVDNKKRVFDVAIGKMEAARRKLNSVCRIKSCGSGKSSIISSQYNDFALFYFSVSGVFPWLEMLCKSMG